MNIKDDFFYFIPDDVIKIIIQYLGELNEYSVEAFSRVNKRFNALVRNHNYLRTVAPILNGIYSTKKIINEFNSVIKKKNNKEVMELKSLQLKLDSYSQRIARFINNYSINDDILPLIYDIKICQREIIFAHGVF